MRVISTLVYGAHLERINSIPSDSVLHINDAFTQEMLDYYFQKGQPAYVVNDHYSSIELANTNCFALPLFAESQAKKIRSLSLPTVETNNCFNFIVNKPQVNRFLCLKLVEWFELQDYNYTWSAFDCNFGMEKIINEIAGLGTNSEITPECKNYIISPVVVPKKTLYKTEQNGNNNIVVDGGVNTGTNKTWNEGLDKIFTHSAISLITESVSYQRAAVFTEKTIYAILGYTFPIWIGGYRQADEFRRMGFDTFDDVVDHSYQHYDTLIQRCYHAFSDNIELLRNKEYVAELRQQCMPRLVKNYQLLTNNQIGKFIDEEIGKYPQDLKQSLAQILYYFRQK
jgi:hypothetical protein